MIKAPDEELVVAGGEIPVDGIKSPEDDAKEGPERKAQVMKDKEQQLGEKTDQDIQNFHDDPGDKIQKPTDTLERIKKESPFWFGRPG
jgi:hypothetical protein